MHINIFLLVNIRKEFLLVLPNHVANFRDIKQLFRILHPWRWPHGWMKQVGVCYVKVRQFHYRPGQAQRAPGGWGSQISRQSAHECGKCCQPYAPAAFTPRKYSWYSFLLEAVNPRAIVGPEGLCQWRIPVTSSGIEPVTFWLVAQCLNQLRHRMPPEFIM